MTATPQAALLISLKDSDFWPADMSLNKWADLVCDELRRLDAENQRLQALLAKLQPAQEAAQEEPTLRDYADSLIEAGHDFWKACKREAGGGAVRWMSCDDGTLIVFTRGEYRDTIMENIGGYKAPEVFFEDDGITAAEAQEPAQSIPPGLRVGDSHMESLIEAAIQGHAGTRDAMRWLVRQIARVEAKPAQAGELPPHVATASKGSVAFFVKWTEAGKPLRGEIHLYTEDQMRAALAARKPLSNAQSQLEALEDLIEDLSEWSRHVIEDTAPATLEKHVREVLKRHGINGLEVKT